MIIKLVEDQVIFFIICIKRLSRPLKLSFEQIQFSTENFRCFVYTINPDLASACRHCITSVSQNLILGGGSKDSDSSREYIRLLGVGADPGDHGPAGLHGLQGLSLHGLWLSEPPV
jgi:hypothetical protein